MASCRNESLQDGAVDVAAPREQRLSEEGEQEVRLAVVREDLRELGEHGALPGEPRTGWVVERRKDAQDGVELFHRRWPPARGGRRLLSELETDTIAEIRAAEARRRHHRRSTEEPELAKGT